MKKRSILVIVGSLALGVIVLALIYRPNNQPIGKTTLAPASTPSPTPELNPLEIAAIRARSYPGGDVKIEQDLGNRTSSHDYIVSYPSDGLKIYALMSVPFTAKPAGGYPVLILNHGYIPPTQYQTDGGDYKAWITSFAGAGYLVFKPDYRGHGKSEGTPEGGHFSPVYAYDALNLVASIKHYPDANGARIGMMGHSLGAHVTLRAIVASTDIKASILAAGVVGSIEDILFNWPRSPMPNDQPRALVSGTREALIKKYGDPHQNPDFWNKVSAINYVSSVTGPVQIHHGTADDQVPKLFSDNLNTALKKAGKPVEYYVYEGGNHQFSGAGRTLLLNRTIGFLGQHL